MPCRAAPVPCELPSLRPAAKSTTRRNPRSPYRRSARASSGQSRGSSSSVAPERSRGKRSAFGTDQCHGNAALRSAGADRGAEALRLEGVTLKRSEENFRHAKELLKGTPSWKALDATIRSITREMVIAEQRKIIRATGSRVPRGGQTVMNRLFDDRLLQSDGWIRQPRLFTEPELSAWKMDFRRDRVGVEVSFNHAEAVAWQFTRLNLAAESQRVLPQAQIDVGIVIVAHSSLKDWARMDGAIGTFDRFSAWLKEMKPILPTPILLIGLHADDWRDTNVFPGTAKGTRSRRTG